MTPKIKNFIKGAGDVVNVFPENKPADFSNNFIRLIIDGPKNTSDAIRGDWQQVGQSFWKTINKSLHE